MEQEMANSESEEVRSISDMRFQAEIMKFREEAKTNPDLMTLIQYVKDDDILQQHRGLICISHLLANRDGEGAMEIIDQGLIPILREFILQDQYLQLRSQALWVIANTAVISCHEIINCNVLPVLFQMLTQTSGQTLNSTMHAIGNIAADVQTYRDMVIQMDQGSKIIQTIGKDDGRLKQAACWVLSQMCLGAPNPPFFKIKYIVAYFCQRLLENKISNPTTWQFIIDTFCTHCHLSKECLCFILSHNSIVKAIIGHLGGCKPIGSKKINFVLQLVRQIAECKQYIRQLISENLLQAFDQNIQNWVGVHRTLVYQILTKIKQKQLRKLMMEHKLMPRLAWSVQRQCGKVYQKLVYFFASLADFQEPQIVLKLYEQHRILKKIIHALPINQQERLPSILNSLWEMLLFIRKQQSGDDVFSNREEIMNLSYKLTEISKNKCEVVQEMVARISIFLQIS